MSALHQLAELAGIEPSFCDYWGIETHVGESTKRALLAAMGFAVDSDDDVVVTLRELERELRGVPPVIVAAHGLPAALPTGTDRWAVRLENGEAFHGDLAQVPLGYHRLTVRCNGTESGAALIVAPACCYVPPAMERGHVRALATQLYALRSRNNWGIGDFTDLAAFETIAGNAGASAVALNPLHELHPSNPTAASPYGPSSRLFLNVLYVDVEAAPEFSESNDARELVGSAQFQARLARLRATELVDYAGVAAAKCEALELLYRSFRANHLQRATDARAAAFGRFRRDGGLALERLALYETLAEFFRARDTSVYGWRQWPPEYRSPESDGVARFAHEHRERVEYHLYVQWLADEQLAATAESGIERGVCIYRDLAVGVDLNGADTWADQRTVLADVSLGAPPDPLNALGQNWELPPLSPLALRKDGYAALAALLRANMRNAGILRVDHVMALRRAFWIPRGHPAVEGAYVRYPFEEMLAVLALESVRNRCAVVGEDLGTVPEGFRERTQDTCVLSSRVLYFERNWSDGSFLPPSSYPRRAAASVGTHDLPTLLGWWTGDDIALRARIGLYPSDDAAQAARDARGQARFALVDALQRDALFDDEGAPRLREDARRGGTIVVAAELATAVHRFLGLTPSMLAVIAIEDILGELGAVNVPGTIHEHPNWRRKRSLTLEELASDNRLLQMGRMLA